MKTILINHLVSNYYTFLRTALRITKGDLEAAKDLVQGLAESILERPEGLEPVQNLDGYLKKALKNNYLSQKRGNRLELGREESEDYSNFFEVESWEESHIEANQFHKVMSFAVSELPKGQLRALTETVSQDGIFISIDGLSPDTVKAARRNAIQKLKAKFAS